MDLGSAIIGLIIMAICALPFILMGRGRKQIEKSLLASLQSQAAQQGDSMNEYNFGSRCAIGLSANEQFILFAKQMPEKAVEHHIRLQTVQRCIANNVIRTVTNGKNKESVIDRLELVFEPKDDKQPVQKLVLYDSNENIQLDNELELLRKWEKRVNVALKTKKVAV